MFFFARCLNNSPSLMASGVVFYLTNSIHWSGVIFPAPEALSHSFQCIMFDGFLCSRGESDGSLQCCPSKLFRLIRQQPAISYSDWDVLLDKKSAIVAEFGAYLMRCNKLPFNTNLCYFISATRQLISSSLTPSSFQRTPRGTRSFEHRGSRRLWCGRLWRR